MNQIEDETDELERFIMCKRGDLNRRKPVRELELREGVEEDEEEENSGDG